MTILINLLVILLVIFVYWFFFGKQEEEGVMASDEVLVTVEGGYKPNVIRVKRGKEVTLNFLRKDPSDCLEEVLIPDLKVRQYLKLGETTPIKIKPEKTGDIRIQCGMNMFHAKIKVE